jgi:phosphoglycolate phosphatase
MKKYKHVIWDWNGTILDDVELCVKMVNRLKAARGQAPITAEKYRAIFGFPVEDYYRAAGFDFSKESFEKVGREWMDGYEKEKYTCGLRAGVTEALDSISASGTGQSVLSAYSQGFLAEAVEHYGLSKYFTRLCGLDTIYAPSKVALGKKLMAELGHGKGETLLIGDTEHDLETARAIGADCVLLAGGHQSREKLAGSGTPVLGGIKELLAFWAGSGGSVQS